MFEDDARFSKKYPLNTKIKDTDVFLHGTSSKRYDAIKSTGYLLRNVSARRNFTISQSGICFEKYVASGKLANANTIDNAMTRYCLNACKNDRSLEGVILQISGRELKKLGCPIFVDWNKPINRILNSVGVPIGVNYNALFLSIIIVDKDIPVEYLEVRKRVPFKEEDSANIVRSEKETGRCRANA